MAVIEEIVEDIAPPQPKKEEAIQEPEVDKDGDLFFESAEYQPDELERLIAESNSYKSQGNTLFASGQHKDAISQYENALLVCPLSMTKERSIYFGNIAACHLKLGEYKEARDMCTNSLKLNPSYHKALLRRAQANEKMGNSTGLHESLTDYKQLSEMEGLDNYTRRECDRAKRELPERIKQKTEQEKEEMMGKLKDLGNTLLGKFGLSTDNFQFVQDSSSGGYSMNFVNSPSEKK